MRPSGDALRFKNLIVMQLGSNFSFAWEERQTFRHFSDSDSLKSGLEAIVDRLDITPEMRAVCAELHAIAASKEWNIDDIDDVAP